MEINTIICGKSQDKLKEIQDNFFDGIITDPPYEIGFMNKTTGGWDSTGIAYSIELWKEVLRVAKPGSHLLCFGGTRTHHRVACAIEDAGWILRDEIDWIYGEGFPKSCNISKQLDKEAGAEGTKGPMKRGGDRLIQLEDGKRDGEGRWGNESGRNPYTTIPATNIAKRWDGYGTALKPAHEPIIVAMKPLEKGLTYAQNAKKWNVAGLNIDGCRVGTEIRFNNPKSNNTKNNTIAYHSSEPSKHGKTVQGRWPSNVILSHSPDCVCISSEMIDSKDGDNKKEIYACVPNCPIRIMDGQSGHMKGGSGETKITMNAKPSWKNSSKNIIKVSHNDSGGASRFFYCAKAKRTERELGCAELIHCVKCGSFDSKTHTIDGIKSNCIRNNHPTVKPIDMMKYLCKLIQMPHIEDEDKQIILDPFCGSGSTLVAAEQLGINYIGIDQELDNVLISTARIGT